MGCVRGGTQTESAKCYKSTEREGWDIHGIRNKTRAAAVVECEKAQLDEGALLHRREVKD